ncbi:chorismate synthase [Candidatus Bipolaricaulota bacterium]|nr:chorismate synthase [Candidatus Bipolaricaulota bacterium]
MRFLTAGESHGPCLIAIVDGIPAGLAIDAEAIDRELARRQGGYGRGGRMRIERDRVEILSGVIAGVTTGAPVGLRIENRDWENWRDRWQENDLPKLTVPRPGHADYAGMVKYGLSDARPILERASARETAMRVAVGSLAKQLLSQFEIKIGSYVERIGAVTAAIPDLPVEELWERAEGSDVRCPDANAAAQMRAAIDAARAAGDTLGGVFTVIATGVPVGLGSHVQWDRRLDARLARALVSIPAVKGIEIGSAFENAARSGREVHDELFPDEEGNVTRVTNRAGGIEGGMSNGAPIVVRAAVKPIPTTLSPLRSVDLATGAAARTEYQRSDVCVVPAAAVVGEAMVAFVLADALLEKFGGDSLAEMKAHWEGARDE